jgi:hypothetical protein
MSRFDPSTGQSGCVGFTPTSGSLNVSWIRPDRPTHLPPPTPRSQAAGGRERSDALVVIVLTLACSTLAVFDLFLLASGA